MTAIGHRRRREHRRARVFWVLLALALAGLGTMIASGQPTDRLLMVAGVAAVLLLLAAWRAQWARMHFSPVFGVDMMSLVALGAGAMDEAGPDERLPDPLRLDPDDAERRPWRDLDAAQVLRRLEQQREAWRQAEQRHLQQQQRQRVLGLALALVDNGVPLRDGSDALPDIAALRAEALLLQADPGPLVLDEVPALHARRYALAIAGSSAGEREVLLSHWQLLRALRPLVPGMVHLRERGWRIARLAWNPQADLDQIDVAYALAADYRQLLRDWLVRAGTVRLEDGMTLEAFLLARCPNLRRDGGDDILQVEAAQPLWPAFVQLLVTALRALEGAAVEREAVGANAAGS